MAINLTEDFKTVEELRADADAVLSQARRTGRPVVITVNGKPSAVVVDAALYEHYLHTMNLARLLGEAEADVRAGRTRPADQVLRELSGGKKKAAR